MIKNETENDDIVIFAGDTNEIDRITQFDYMKRVITDYTFNPQENDFAFKTSKKQISTHYDRIYYSHNLNLISNEVRKSQLSDHYPVIAFFNFNDDYIPPVGILTNNKCALVIIPENPIKNGSIISLPRYNTKWMPHINLLWPFIEIKDLIPYMYQLNNIKFSSFHIKITEYDCFEHDKTLTLYMKLKNEDILKLQEIRNKFLEVLTFIPSSQRDKWTPHLSVENISKDDYLDDSGKFSKEIFKRKVFFGSPITFEVNNLFYISRVESETMKIERIFPSNNIKEIKSKNTSDGKFYYEKIKMEIVSFFKRFCDIVEICGSDRIYKINNELLGSNLDLCCFGEISKEIFFKRIEQPMRERGFFYDFEFISGHMTGIKLRTPYFTVDLHYNDDTNVIIPDTIIRTAYTRENYFLNYYKIIRKIFEDGNVYGQVYGYFASIHIAILASRIVNSANLPNDDKEIALRVLEILNNEPIISPRCEFNFFDKKDPSDNVLIMTLDGQRNLVRTMYQRSLNTTKNILAKYGKTGERYGIQSYSHKIYLILKSTDQVVLEKLQDKINSHIRNFVIALNKTGNDARIGNKWYKSEINGIYCITFIILYNPNTNLFDYHREGLSESINNFIDSYVEFEYKIE